MRDSQRQRVYDAGASISGRSIGRETIQETVAYVDRVVSSSWWRQRSGVNVVEVKDGRGRRSAVAWHNVIAIPRWARNERTVLHELAHVLAYDADPPHGPQYAAAYLALVDRFMGPEAGRALREAYAKHRVKWRGHPVPKVARPESRCEGCDRTSTRPMPWRVPVSGSLMGGFHSKACARAWFERSVKRVDQAAARRA